LRAPYARAEISRNENKRSQPSPMQISAPRADHAPAGTPPPASFLPD
jgi:hypothetical protein